MTTVEQLLEKIDVLLKVSKELPVHDLDDLGTSYIDYLGFDLNPIKYNAMRGVDKYWRIFFVFKIIIIDPRLKKGISKEYYHDRTMFFMDTLFQRYSNSDSSYQVCGHYMDRTIFTCGGTRLAQFQFYIDLLTKGEAIITSDIIPTHDQTVGWTAILGSQEEWKAARLIQRAWRTVRINPEYYMCKRVQMRDVIDLGGEPSVEEMMKLFPKWTQTDFFKVFPKLTAQ